MAIPARCPPDRTYVRTADVLSPCCSPTRSGTRSGWHPGNPVSQSVPACFPPIAVLHRGCALPDDRSPAPAGRPYRILTQKDMDGLFPSAQTFLAVHHHGPTNLSVIPLLA